MKTFVWFVTLAAAASLDVTSASDCSTAPNDACGNANTGAGCCPKGQYCQPWNAAFYQCVDIPNQCQVQHSDVEFSGKDLKTILSIQPSDCCRECAATPNCKGYTFMNNIPGQPACVLKSELGDKIRNVGAVSGGVGGNTPGPSSPTPTPAPKPTPTTSSLSPSCSTAPYDRCGSASAGASCCPDKFYCQPWDADFYQCIPTPPRCSKQLTDFDFSGNDLATIYAIQVAKCCEECAKHPDCKAYTYINGGAGQPLCYLKSKASDSPQKLVGAVSGLLTE
jgi:hypothetical protein